MRRFFGKILNRKFIRYYKLIRLSKWKFSISRSLIAWNIKQSIFIFRFPLKSIERFLGTWWICLPNFTSIFDHFMTLLENFVSKTIINTLLNSPSDNVIVKKYIFDLIHYKYWKIFPVVVENTCWLHSCILWQPALKSGIVKSISMIWFSQKKGFFPVIKEIWKITKFSNDVNSEERLLGSFINFPPSIW